MRSRLGIAADVAVVVCVGRMVPRNGQDTLVWAWPQVHAMVPDALLLLVGAGRYRHRVEQLGIARCRPLGAVHRRRPAGRHSGVRGRGQRLGHALPQQTCGARGRSAAHRGPGGGRMWAACDREAFRWRARNRCGRPNWVVVVDLTDVALLCDRLADLLQAPADTVLMGKRGRERMAAEWTWQASAEALATMSACANTDVRARNDARPRGSARTPGGDPARWCG